VTQKAFGQGFDALVGHLKVPAPELPGGGGVERAGAAAAGAAIGREDLRRCFFGDYLDASVEPGDRQYREVCGVQRRVWRVVVVALGPCWDGCDAGSAWRHGCNWASLAEGSPL
jgi:hypothetical protein